MNGEEDNNIDKSGNFQSLQDEDTVSSEAARDNISNDIFTDEDLNDIHPETAAAIDSLVENMDHDHLNDVGDLQDDVDLGLDVLDGSGPSSPIPDPDQDDEYRDGEVHRSPFLEPPPRDIESPHDIEIESPQDIEIEDESTAEFAQITSDIYSRRLDIRLERLRIGSNCYVANGSVDLKRLRDASPGLFKNVPLGKKRGRKKKSETENSEDNQNKKKAKKEKVSKKEIKKENKKEVKKKEKSPQKLQFKFNKKPATDKKVTSSAISSDSDSDSDLEELRRKMMKPGAYSQLPKYTAPPASKSSETNNKKVKEPAKKSQDKSNKKVQEKPKKPIFPSGGLIVKPFSISVKKLSQKEIDRWKNKKDKNRHSSTDSKSKDKKRHDSTDSKSHSKTLSKAVISSSSSSSRSVSRAVSRSSSSSRSSDDDDEATKRPMAPNPLFLMNKETNKKADDLKKLLMEKLESILEKEVKPDKPSVESSEEPSDKPSDKPSEKPTVQVTEKPPEKSTEKIPEKSTEDGDKTEKQTVPAEIPANKRSSTDDVKITEEKSKEKKKDEQHHKKIHSEPEESSKSSTKIDLKRLYSNNKESIDVKAIAHIRPFAELLKIEKESNDLSFLGHYRIQLRDLEAMVHEVIANLEEPRKFKKPKSLPMPSSYEKAKFKINLCYVQLKDIKKKKSFLKALDVYNLEKPLRIKRKKSKLLHYLKTVADNRMKSESSSIKRKTVVVSSDDESESESKPESKPKKQKVDDLTHLGSFK